MRRITITLTEEEYAVLEQRAAQDRRTPREMAAYLVTRGEQYRIIPTTPYYPPLMPWQNPVISSGDISNPLCPACTNPSSTAGHTCIRTWNSSITAANTTIN